MIKYLSIPLQEIARYQFPKSTPISRGEACEINMLACGELESYTYRRNDERLIWYSKASPEIRF